MVAIGIKYRVTEKPRNLFPTNMFYLKQINYTEIKKNNVVQSVENVHLIQRCINALSMYSLFSSCLIQPGIVSVSRKRFTRRDTVDLFGTGELGNVPLNSF
jgi:hypothetical protein